MFYENKKTTYKEIFKIFENTQSSIYYNLPEDSLKDKIYKVRMIHGLTQSQLAVKTGVSYSCICKYESGRNMSKENKEKICNAFNIPLEYFN